ncbi:MAG: RHS repeat-associated core domain-containing protein [Crocinitomicaceae bacterium]|nr:RHS repeat-associated core domain-containing protein [Crocinitomicaceae bacterium]
MLREYVNTSTGDPEKFLTTQHERDKETGLDYRGARFYDSDVARFLSIDPMQIARLHLTPYNYVSGNPIKRIDPDGRLDDEYDKDGNKISNLGGDKIDFHHQANGDTKITDKETGASNIILGGESLIRGYTQRSKDTGWGILFDEWDLGFGPQKSIYSDFNNTTQGVFGSFDNPLSVFSSKARAAVLSEGKNKGTVDYNYSDINPATAGTDGWQQFLGRANMSYYKLGDKVLFMVNDSKTMTSFAYRMWPFGNHERGNTFWGNSGATTHQTYIWTETMTEINQKNTIKNEAVQKYNQSREYIERTEPQRMPAIKW